MKRKVLTFVLTSAMTLGSIVPTMANSSTSNTNQNNESNIETLIGFRYPETVENLKGKDLKATLIGEGGTAVEIGLNELLEKNVVVKNGYQIISEVNQENKKVNSIKFKITGLKPYKKYNLMIDGKNYVKTSVELDTTKYSKRVNIDTGATLNYGDVNDDEVINEKDLKILEENLNKNNSQYDLNGDGIVSISDIAIINKNIQSLNKPVVYDTDLNSGFIIENISNISNIASNVQVSQGKIEDIFKPDGEVKLAPKQGGQNVNIPIDFKQPQEISKFTLTLPDGTPQENVTVKFYDENNNLIQTEQPNVVARARIARSRNTETVVTIDLGNRVPVKKIVVDVKPSDNGYVVVKDVQFIKDVVNDNILEDTTVKNIKAIPGNEEVSLSWRAVPNVKGYKVYYGTDKNKLDKTKEFTKNEGKIDGLKNLTTYYFQISAISDSWEGTKSEIVSATPEPKTIPERPDFVNLEAGNASIKVNWKDAKNAEWYNVYIQEGKDGEIKKALSDIKQTNATVYGLKNDVEYTVYVTSQNSLGESNYSEPRQATPIKEEIVIPNLPTNKRISNENIESVKISNKNHYDKNLYPGGFDENWVIDENYETSWVGANYWDENSFTFTFKEAKDMDYLVWVPRLDGNYRKSNDHYTITVWTDKDELQQNKDPLVFKKPITQKGEKNSYYILTFPKQTNVKKIKVQLGESAGGPRVNASEVVFYEYNDISDRIGNLFANNIRTQLKPEVQLSHIQKLREEVNDTNGFIYEKEVLLKELGLAEGLLKNDNSVLGIIKEGVDSINPSVDSDKYKKAINNYQPLGIAAKSNEKISIYAEIPEGEKVEIIATQYFEQADSFQSKPIQLVNGVNYITVPVISTTPSERGGSLYLTYSGQNPDKIKLHIRGGQKIPYLELKNLHTMSEQDAKQEIGKFIDELTVYTKTLKGNLQHNVLNSSEISLPDVLLSLPASEVLKGIEQGVASKEEQINKVYNNVLAWEDLIDVIYKTYGIDDHKQDGLKTRQNIRYMKMFSNAFMYAAGNHIGIGFSSVAGLMNGKPVSQLEEGATSNNIFGWGIAHEIGHVMDALGKAEITNNIYSLMAQTYDGKANTLKSRLELGGVYEKAYDKVSVGKEGVPNDVFVQLVMYWQLHLAYDEAENPTQFYNQLHKLYRSGELNGLQGMDKFAVASSKIANKNLTTFFERWGVKLSDNAKSQMQSLAKEERAIYYLNDESRRQRLNGNKGNKEIQISATSSVAVNDKKDQEVTISITPTGNAENILGYEIIRNGKSIGFTTTNTYKDIIDSANNMAFTYEVTPIDILGNIGNTVNAGEVRISYDDVIKTGYNILENGVVKFNEEVVVSGIKVTPKNNNSLPKTGEFKVTIKVPTKDGSNFENIVAKNGNFSENDSKNENTYVTYFNKPNASESEKDKMFTYETSELTISGIDLTKYNVEFIQYPGDDVQFMETGVGILESAYGDIPAGTLVVMGTYRGSTGTNDIIVKGKFATSNSLDDISTFEERAINGEIYMLDSIEEDGKITYPTKEGIFIFVPDIQKEADLQGKDCHAISVLPSQIKAEMSKQDTNGTRVTSDTLWTNMPSFDTLPKIKLTGGGQ